MTLLQQRIATGVLLLVALWVFWISFSQQPAAAFLFPRLISVAFVALAGWTFARAAAGRPGSGDVISLEEAKNILPGVVVAGLYVFVAAKWLGFYTASAIAFSPCCRSTTRLPTTRREPGESGCS